MEEAVNTDEKDLSADNLGGPRGIDAPEPCYKTNEHDVPPFGPTMSRQLSVSKVLDARNPGGSEALTGSDSRWIGVLLTVWDLLLDSDEEEMGDP